MIYLDYSATTPVDRKVIDAYTAACIDYIGNPNSTHKLGLAAKKAIDEASLKIANILNINKNEIIFTSGASESNNTIIKGICSKYKHKGKKIITTELEHSSVIGPLNYLSNQGFDIEFINLDKNGQIDLNDLKDKIDNDTILVTIASVNSETGIKQPLKKISEIIKAYPNCFFHSDMAQSLGKEVVDLSLVDFASFSAQKFYGMKGVGILYKKEGLSFEPLIHGGKSTTAFRSGTPALPLILSTAKALEIIYDDFDKKLAHINKLNKYLLNKLSLLPVYINSTDKSIKQIVNISLKDAEAKKIIKLLEEDEIYISTKTACSNKSMSSVIYALYNDEKRASNSLRISISHLTTKTELDYFFDKLNNALSQKEK